MNKQTAINLGLVYAASAIVIFLLQALMGGEMIFSFVVGLLTLVVVIALPIVYIRKQRKENGGFISFADAFKLAFIGLLIGGAISTTFGLLYMQFIDPDYGDTVIMNTLESQKNWMEGNVPQEQMEETMRLTEEGMRDSFTPLGIAKTFGYYILFYLIISLIFAAFLKSTPHPKSISLDGEEVQSAN